MEADGVCSITIPDDSTNSNSGAQPPEQTTSQSNGDSGLTAAAKAGFAVAAIGGIFLGLLAAFGIQYWRKLRNESKALGDSAEDKEGDGSDTKP